MGTSHDDSVACRQCAASLQNRRVLRNRRDHRSCTGLPNRHAKIEPAVAAGPRHLPSALAWTDAAEWAAVLPPRMVGQASPTRQHTRTLEMREATLRLQSAIEREAVTADSTRRLWITTGAAAIAAIAAGFALGRMRGRRSSPFRPGR